MIAYSGNEFETCEYIIHKYIDADMSFGEFMTEFRAALVRKEISLFNNIKLKTCKIESLELQGGGSVIIELNEPYTVEQCSEKIKFVGIEPKI